MALCGVIGYAFATVWTKIFPCKGSLFASMTVSAGESPMWVAQQTGCKGWTMIAYGKWIKDTMPNAGGKAVEMFGKAAKKAVIPKLNRHLMPA